MSQNVLPDADTAYGTLFEQVHANVFFRKCAAAGFVPNNDEEARAMLEGAGRLRQVAEQQELQKAASDNSFYHQFNNGLISLTGAVPVEKYAAAASQLMQDPSIYNAVLSLRSAEAEAIQQDLAAAAGQPTTPAAA